MLPRVDVVIPVFNEIEDIDRCVNSVLDQTYTNFNIILVDDGSCDGSEIKCDEYAGRFENVNVIHQKNRGLGAARNTGVSISDADYILFVDADDYIDKRMIELLVEVIIEKKADMSTMKLAAIYDEHTDNMQEDVSEKDIIILETQDALEDMCYMRYFGFSACSKLIKRDLLLRYPFPEDFLYEDSAVMYKIVAACKLIVHINKLGYFYIQRMGKGITRGIYNDSYKDGIVAAEDLKQYLIQNFPMIVDAGNYRIAYSAYLITKTLTGGTAEEKQNYREIKDYLCQAFYKGGVYKNSKVDIKRRIQIGLATLGYAPMVVSWKIYYMIIKSRRM